MLPQRDEELHGLELVVGVVVVEHVPWIEIRRMRERERRYTG
jgi:hypothetical protein